MKLPARCPPNFPSGYFWYEDRRHGPGRPSKWIDNVMAEEPEQNMDKKWCGFHGGPVSQDVPAGAGEEQPVIIIRRRLRS